jgi:hypothetical protein
MTFVVSRSGMAALQVNLFTREFVSDEHEVAS